MLRGIKKQALTTSGLRKKILPGLLVFVVLSLLILQVFVSNWLATSGLEISEIDHDIQNLTAENADLRQQIASASSLTTLRTKAADLGFIYPARPVFFNKEPVVALDLK